MSVRLVCCFERIVDVTFGLLQPAGLECESLNSARHMMTNMDDSWVGHVWRSDLFVRDLFLCTRRAVHKKLVGVRCCVLIDESIIFPGSLRTCVPRGQVILPKTDVFYNIQCSCGDFLIVRSHFDFLITITMMSVLLQLAENVNH